MRPPDVASVGVVSIDESQLEGWVGAFAPGPVGDGLSAAERVVAKPEATSFLIRSEWIRAEVRRRGIRLSRAVRARMTKERTRQFRGPADLDRYLDETGMTKEQFRERIERDALARELMLTIESPDLSVSRADVARFYARHRSEFDQPAARDLHVVVTRSRARALEARRELGSDRPWASVAREFTVDASKRNGGRITIDRANLIPVLRDAVFAADVGRISGPLDLRGYWWIFRVDRDRPAHRLTLAEATPRIRISISSTREQLALDRLNAYLTRRYRPRTVCHPGHSAPECRNRKPLPMP